MPFITEIPGDLVDVRQSPNFFARERIDPRANDIYSFFGSRKAVATPPVAPQSAPYTSRSAPGRAMPAPIRERTVVRDPDATPVFRPVKRGSRVRHPTLGQGVVLEMDGQGEEAKITVFFDKVGKRKLVAKFANLEML